MRSILTALALVLVLQIAPVLGAGEDQPSIIALSSLESVTVKIAAPSSYQTGSAINFTIRHWPDGEVLSQGKIEAGKVGKDELGLPVFTVLNLKPKFWSLQDPQLYTIEVSDSSGKEIGKTRFGFRTFEIKDRKFYLNGRPIFLRGWPINPPGRDLPEETGKDPAFIKGYLKLVKSAGANIVRTESDQWLDASDELGLLQFIGRYGPAFGGDGKKPPTDFEKCKERYRQVISELASHPSVVIYVLTNEVDYKSKTSTYKEFLTKIREDVRLLDPTRPVIGNAGFGHGEPGEIYDLHPYAGWYSGNMQDWYRVFSQYIVNADKANQPLTFSECVGAYTCDQGEFLTMSKQLCTRTRWIGTAEDQRAASLEYQAELVKQVVEIGRRQRTEKTGVAGIFPFTYLLGWASAKSVDDLIKKPAFDAFKTAFQPILISPECWKRNIYAGDNLEFRISISNDDDNGKDIGPAQAIIDISNGDGKRIGSSVVPVSSIPYYSNVWKDVSIPIPEDTSAGTYAVKCRLQMFGATISTNAFDITVGKHIKMEPTVKTVTLYDPSEKTSAALDLLGVAHKKMADVSQIPEDGIMVIGEEAFSSGSVFEKSAISKFVESGGRIICLRQKQEDWKNDWLPVKLNIPVSRSCTYINPVGRNKQIFDGIEARDLRIWNQTDVNTTLVPDVSPVVSPLRLVSADDVRSCRVWASTDQLLSGHAIVEVFQGKGSILLSQFRCIERVKDDPVAAKLLANLLNYANSTDHPAYVDLTQPVKWDSEVFCSGIFVSNIQGLLPHSDTYKHTGSSKGMLGADHRINGFTLAGSYKFNGKGWMDPVPDPKIDGWGKFCGTLLKPADRFLLTLRNPSTESASIKLKLDGKEVGSPVMLSSGEDKTVEWKIERQDGPVLVELVGDQDLVITESSFE